ncbi:MAG: hypothetical protein ACRDE5_00830, partial [Ginsengibacter sp.]
MFIGFFGCLIISFFDNTIILGINAMIKPMKFCLSIGIVSWTMGWLTYYLTAQKKVMVYSWALVVTLLIEIIIIFFQAARGQRSHFNYSTPFNGILYGIMGLSITVFVLWTLYICILFFLQKEFDIPKTYLLAIRLGLVLFVLFTLEGYVIVGNSGHTVGAPDGSAGLPFVNWSKEYGDLRVAHFLGMHALQIVPLTGYFLARKKMQVILFVIIYFLFVT